MTHLKTLSLLCALALVPLAGRAGDDPARRHHPDVVSTGRSIEASTATTLLPTSDRGRITVNQCAGCRSETFSVGETTRYLIGARRATLNELRQVAGDGRNHAMIVTVGLADGAVLSVQISNPAGAP